MSGTIPVSVDRPAAQSWSFRVNSPTRSSMAVALALGLAVPACSPPAPPAEHRHEHGHEHAVHDHPDTLAEGIAELTRAATDVEKHLAAGATDAADGIVHGIGHIVEDIQAILPKEKLSAEGRAAAAKALDEIFECFDAIDTALHAPAGKGTPPADVHAGVKERIEAAIAALQAAR